METGYRFFYMDYVKNDLTYDAAQSGLFMGVGVNSEEVHAEAAKRNEPGNENSADGICS